MTCSGHCAARPGTARRRDLDQDAGDVGALADPVAGADAVVAVGDDERVPLAAAASPGTKVNLEIPVSHHYVHVGAQTARMPLYNPARKTA